MKKNSFLVFAISFIFCSPNIYTTGTDGLLYNRKRASSQSNPFTNSPSRCDLTPSDRETSPNTPNTPTTIQKRRSALVTFITDITDAFEISSFSRSPKIPTTKAKPIPESPEVKSILSDRQAQYFVLTALDKELFKKIILFKILNKKLK